MIREAISLNLDRLKPISATDCKHTMHARQCESHLRIASAKSIHTNVFPQAIFKMNLPDVPEDLPTRESAAEHLPPKN